MGYPKTNQQSPGHLSEENRNPKNQPGSRSNQRASNAARGTDRATSDHFPSQVSTNPTAKVRPDVTGQKQRGYVNANSSGLSEPRKVGNRAKRQRM